MENNNNKSNLDILKEQCSKSSKYDDDTLIKLLEVNNYDIVDCIFNIEDEAVHEKIIGNNDVFDWEQELNRTNFDSKTIRKIFDIKDKLYQNLNQH